MNKKNVIIVLSLMLVLTTAVYAHFGLREGNIGYENMQNHHEQMEVIMEDGSYADLVELRKELGFSMMPWVNNDEDLDVMKEHHEQMEELGGMGGGMHGCPMMGD